MCRLTALKVFSKWGTGAGEFVRAMRPVDIVPQDRAPMHHTQTIGTGGRSVQVSYLRDGGNGWDNQPSAKVWFFSFPRQRADVRAVVRCRQVRNSRSAVSLPLLQATASPSAGTVHPALPSLPASVSSGKLPCSVQQATHGGLYNKVVLFRLSLFPSCYGLGSDRSALTDQSAR